METTTMGDAPEWVSRAAEPMQVIHLVGGPADDEVALVHRAQTFLVIQQPAQPEQGIITGRYVATQTFSPRGYPAWSWILDENAVGDA